MAKTRLSQKALYVERGYGQVEPNHLSAQRTGQIYAQLPAESSIELLENGQFVKYDYENECVDFAGPGEWMLVFNEVKVYREWESDADFAMIKSNYVARVYSPIDGTLTGANGQQLTQPRDYSKVVTPADPYEPDSTANPFASQWDYKGPKEMPKFGTPEVTSSMVPRVFKTNVGDIFTTNCIAESTVTLGATLYVGDDGYLTATKGTNSGDMKWQVVKLYDLGDRQKAAKLMRIK